MREGDSRKLRELRRSISLLVVDLESVRGEIVLLIDRARAQFEADKDQTEMDVAARVNALEAEGLDNRAALKRAARELGLNRSEAYRRLVAAREQQKKA